MAGAEPRISRHCVLFLSLSFLRFGFPFFVVSFPFFSRSRLPLLFLSRHFVGRAASHGKWITRRRSRDEALTNSFYRALLGFIDFHVRSTNFTGLYWVLLGFIGFYWILHVVIPSVIVVHGHCSTSPVLSDSGFTGLDHVLPSLVSEEDLIKGDRKVLNLLHEKKD